MTLPIDRTKLLAYTENAAPNNVFASTVAKDTMKVAYDTIDELYNNFNNALSFVYNSDKFTQLSIVNVKDKQFGAKGDGLTDDTTSFESAIIAASGRILYVPTSSDGYLITRTLNMTNCSVVFADGAFLIPKPGTAIQPVIDINGAVFKTYRNLAIVSATRDGLIQSGIRIRGLTNRIRVEGIRLYNLSGYGMELDTVWDSHFEKINIEQCGNVTGSYSGLRLYSSTGDTTNQCTLISIQTEKCFYMGLNVEDTAYSNRFMGIHAEWHSPTTGNFIKLGGYRNQYYGSGHLGANYEKVYVGGESNLYHGIFFDSPIVEGTAASPTSKHYISDCVVPSYTQLGGSLAVFHNCSVSGTLTINGNPIEFYGGSISILNHVFSPVSQDVLVVGTTITTLTQGGSGAKNLRLNSCIVVNNVTMQGTGLILKNTEFKGTYTQNYVGGSKQINGCTFTGAVNLSGGNAVYGSKLYHCVILSTLTVDVNNASELHYCSIAGVASGDSTSKLIKCYAPSGTGALAVVA